jgi:signal peptidase II
MTDASARGPRSPRLRTVAVLGLLVACVACDRATKCAAVERLVPGERRSFLADTFRLELADNTGAFLSMGASLPEGVRRYALTVGPGLVALGALVVAMRGRSRTRVAVAAALVAAGGLGNVWDRLANGGRVVDFMNAGVGGLRTGVFNVADVALVVAVLLLLVPSRPPAASGGHGPAVPPGAA